MMLIGALALALPSVASATRVIELGGGTTPAARAPLTVPGRYPRPGSTASASSLRVLDASEAATRMNGKIFGVDPKEGNYTCSGTAVNTPSRSIVLTAGHCVVLEGEAASRIAFVPAYDHGVRPFGTFEVTSVYVTPQWRHAGKPRLRRRRAEGGAESSSGP